MKYHSGLLIGASAVVAALISGFYSDIPLPQSVSLCAIAGLVADRLIVWCLKRAEHTVSGE